MNSYFWMNQYSVKFDTTMKILSSAYGIKEQAELRVTVQGCIDPLVKVSCVWFVFNLQGWLQILLLLLF